MTALIPCNHGQVGQSITTAPSPTPLDLSTSTIKIALRGPQLQVQAAQVGLSYLLRSQKQKQASGGAKRPVWWGPPYSSALDPAWPLVFVSPQTPQGGRSSSLADGLSEFGQEANRQRRRRGAAEEPSTDIGPEGGTSAGRARAMMSEFAVTPASAMGAVIGPPGEAMEELDSPYHRCAGRADRARQGAVVAIQYRWENEPKGGK
ncbi:hypothetical protein THAOC_02328 [Thalassiosira oceanica]|uniref:Uncharacterized protein n=1 Tax=Thalassiosira oceanica TaxID=159749 RepID=K0TEU0_THAOC|nr:hypothetical protein THAOC_02328 [Thalassiosira oceanica]|eukprot:EJK75935.1 hypothetical protein THAOC_02328 [Thalassiosira oceanica]